MDSLIVEERVGYDFPMFIVGILGDEPVLVVFRLIALSLPRIKLEHIIVKLVLMLKVGEVVEHTVERLLS